MLQNLSLTQIKNAIARAKLACKMVEREHLEKEEQERNDKVRETYIITLCMALEKELKK